MTARILIENALVLTMTGPGVGAVPGGVVAITGNRLAAVGPVEGVAPAFRPRADRVIDGRGKVVLPGLIDGHIHSPLALLRGLAQDMHHWMQLGLAPYTAELSPGDLVAGSSLAAVESVRAGTTTLLDHAYPMRQICEEYLRLGIRARVAGVINELPARMSDIPLDELYPFDPARGQLLLQDNLRLIEEWHGRGNGRITCMLGPQAPDMLSRELLLEIRAAAARLGVGLHMHVAQGDREIRQMAKRYGRRPVEFLDELGLLDPGLLAVHLTEATPAEAALVARRGAGLACCPGSIAIIDGIVTPLMEFLEAGGTAALGTDQAPGNNCHNLWNEMKLVALLNKVRFRDPTVLPAWKALRLATVEAARAVGLPEAGTLEPGKLADLIIVNLRSPTLAPHLEHPVRNVVPNLVYAARGHEVETVIIDGQVVVDEGRLVTVDEEAVVARAQAAAVQAAGRAARTVQALGAGPAALMREGLL